MRLLLDKRLSVPLRHMLFIPFIPLLDQVIELPYSVFSHLSSTTSPLPASGPTSSSLSVHSFPYSFARAYNSVRRPSE
jgi:hypothetical protein